jgi:hypothetical protein
MELKIQSIQQRRKLILWLSADRVKRGQCALTPLTSVKGRFNTHRNGYYLY